MQAPFDNIVQHLFHQPSLLSVTVPELERMAAQHPYFAAAHFLLLKKMQDTQHPDFGAQLHKTTLYFNNPLWLQFLLQPDSVSNFTVSDEAPFIKDELPAGAASPEVHDKEETNAEPENNLSIAGSNGQEKLAHQEQPLQAGAAAPPAPASVIELVDDIYAEELTTHPALPAEEEKQEWARDREEAPATLDKPAIATEEHTHTDEVQENLPVAAEEFQVSAETVVDNEQATENTNTSQEEEHHSESTIAEQHPATEEAAAQPAVEEPIAATVLAPAHEEALQAVDASSSMAPAMQPVEEAVAWPAENDTLDDRPDGSTEPHGGEEMPATGKPLLQIIETSAASADMLFEPFHTVDYFASQGIKLSKTETDSKDKLGRQLKSFTEWLKTMKKLPQVSIENILSQNEESKVVADAIHSIENKEVITEAMAEVYEKQGLREKAVEVYNKLSLLNPAKSAYFAAKIDDLK